MHDHSKEIVTFDRLFRRLTSTKGIRCPNCESKDDFALERNDCMDVDCDMNHPEDQYYCLQCNETYSATDILDLHIGKENEVMCPLCAGTGFVKQKLVERFNRMKNFYQNHKANRSSKKPEKDEENGSTSHPPKQT